MSFFESWPKKVFQEEYWEITLPKPLTLTERKRIFYLHEELYLTCFVHPADSHCLLFDTGGMHSMQSYLALHKVNAALLKEWLLLMMDTYESVFPEGVWDSIDGLFLDDENLNLHFLRIPAKPDGYQQQKAFLHCLWELLEAVNFDGDEAWLSNLYMLSRQQNFRFAAMRRYLKEKPVRRRFPFWFKKQSYEDNDFFQTFEVHEQAARYQSEPLTETTLLYDAQKTQVLMSGYQLGYLEDEKKQVVFISQTPWLVGRQETCHLCLAYPEVSKQHAKLIAEDGCSYVVDLNSTNHTALNGKIIASQKPEQLKDGDTLCFAGHCYTYHV